MSEIPETPKTWLLHNFLSLRARILVLKIFVLLPLIVLLGYQTWHSTQNRLDRERQHLVEIATLASSIDPTQLDALLAGLAHLPNDALVVAVDPTGRILAPQRWQGQNIADKPEFSAITHDTTPEFEALDTHGNPRTYLTRPLHSANVNAGYLYVSAPSIPLFSIAFRALLYQALPVLLLAIALLLFGWYSSRRLLLDPINRLRDAARQIGKGDFSTRTQLHHGYDELGQLATSIDDMASALEKSERWRNLVLDAAELGAWDLDLLTNRSYRTLRHNQIFGYDTVQHEWDAGIFFKHIFPEDQDYIRSCYERALATGQHEVEIRIRRVDGAIRWINIKGQVLFDENHRPVRMVGVMADITERKQAEIEQLKLNRTLHLLSEANEALLRIRSEDELLHTLCQLITIIGGYRLAWVGLLSSDDTPKLLPVAQSGIENTEDRVQLNKSAKSSGYGPIDTAINTTQPVVVQNIEQDPIYEPWREEALQRGFLSTIVLPLMNQNGVIGAISIYSSEIGTFDHQEVTLLEKLANNLAYGIANLRETGTRERYERQLDYQARFDTLTALPNRNQFIENLQNAIAEAQRTNYQVSVLLLDLDRFKTINDTLGHDAGDQLLQLIGQRLAQTLRDEDTISRLAVDEFGLIITHSAPCDHLASFANRLLQTVSEPFTLLERDIVITSSIGISVYPRNGHDAENLLQGAYAAMYNAKEQGGNAFQFYAHDMNQHLSKRLALEAAMRRSLDQGGFELYYQPKVDLLTNDIIGAEALLRWNHPDLGMVSPVEFIPLAEETGLIIPLGTWVLDTTCHQIRTWLDQGIMPPPIAVNLSARQFRQENLAQHVQEILEKHHLPPEYLILEITESTAMVDVEKAIAILTNLKDIGVKLALDDFGTGYSSLSYLKRLPIDQLKIDRSFVRDITTDPDDAAICIAVVGLGHNLKLSVVAEGVETEGQAQFLRENRCDEMQGFLFSRPVPTTEFITILQQHRQA